MKEKKLFILSAGAGLCIGSCLVLVLCSFASASMSPADETLIVSSISGADTLFYKIGGAILVVLAGFTAWSIVLDILDENRRVDLQKDGFRSRFRGPSS